MVACLALLGATAAGAAANAIGPAHRFAPRQLVVKFAGEPHARTVGLPRGAGVLATARALRARPNVEYAEPNYAAHASAVELEPVDPDDPGTLELGATGSDTTPGGWATKQWDFLDYTGTATDEAADLPRRDRRARRLGQPGSGRPAGRQRRARRRPRQRHRLPRPRHQVPAQP